METLKEVLKDHPHVGTRDFSILEFGCGDGYQIPFLRKFGTVVASDIYETEGMKTIPDVEFRICPIQSTPFSDDRFDLIFSNHVMQYIPERELTAFHRELARIGKADCLFVFTVPTSLWLTLALPAQYYEKLRWILGKLFQRRGGSVFNSDAQPQASARETKSRESLGHRLAHALLPIGSGSYHPFLHARTRFRVCDWISRLEAVGFRLVRSDRLLLYAPSEWPIVPTSRWFALHGFASSVLLVFKDADSAT